jgi:type IV secretion system protein VirB8
MGRFSLPPAAQNTDTLGAYPTQVGVQPLEGRRHLWTTRVFAIAFYVSMLLNVVLGVALALLSPLKRVEPFLVSFDQQQNMVVRVQPFQKTASGFALFTEKMAGEFVQMREEVLTDEAEMRRRWNEYIRPRLNESDYQAFITRIGDTYPKLKERRISRRVKIDRILRRSDMHVEVYFTANDYTGDAERVRTAQYLARLRVEYSPKEIKEDEQYFNPLGFTVVDYSTVQN